MTSIRKLIKGQNTYDNEKGRNTQKTIVYIYKDNLYIDPHLNDLYTFK